MTDTWAGTEAPKVAPYFSIILPIYNVAPYLEQCIRSVLDQRFQDFELILVDDGSTDSSPEICDDYAARYDNIRVIHKPNGGLSSARNAGTRIAGGRYIWWVDSDDWVEPDALDVLYAASCDRLPDMVKFDFNRVGQQMCSVNSCAEPGIYRGEELEILREKAFLRPGKYSLSAWSHIYSRDFLKRARLSFDSERTIGSEDYLFNLEALLEAEQILVIRETLYNYRLREGSLTQRYRKDLSFKYTQLYRQLCGYYVQMGKLDAYEGWISHFYVWHLIHGTCLANEYRDTQDHSRKEGRKNISAFFRSPDFQYAVHHCEKQHFTRNQRVQLLAMQLGLEPLFYWLFVIKPRLKKGK